MTGKLGDRGNRGLGDWGILTLGDSRNSIFLVWSKGGMGEYDIGRLGNQGIDALEDLAIWGLRDLGIGQLGNWRIEGFSIYGD